MSDALDRQIGGNHYKTLGIQPLEVTYKNFGYHGLLAAVYCKVNKYITRKKGDHAENLNKAIHCIEIARDIHLREKNQGGELNEQEEAIIQLMADEMGIPFDMVAREFTKTREEVNNAKSSPPSSSEIPEDVQRRGNTPPVDG